MKSVYALVFAVVCLSLISTAEANDTRTQFYNTTLVYQSQAGKACPAVGSIVAIQKPGSLDGELLYLKDAGGRVVASLKFTYANTHCISDMICLTDNNYESYKGMLVSLTRNNDGNYPTQDLAGYSDLNIYITAPIGQTGTTCNYMLND